MDYHNIIKHSPKLLQKWEFNTSELYHNFLYIPRVTESLIQPKVADFPSYLA